jgi:predicted nucleotidyltransferase
MNRREVIAKAETALRRVYKDYRKRGIVAIYLWGSVLSRDYRYGKSDIDAIAIVRDTLPLKYEKKIKEFLGAKIENFRIRFLYIGELNGKQIKSNLATFIDPRLLLYDLPHWRHVAGKIFKRKDFMSSDLDARGAIQLTIAQIYKRNLPELKMQIGREKYSILIKALARLCHYLQSQNGKPHSFSYFRLRKTTNHDTQSIVMRLLKLRNRGWDRKIFMKELPRFIRFLAETKRRYPER